MTRDYKPRVERRAQGRAAAERRKQFDPKLVTIMLSMIDEGILDAD